MFHTFYVDLSHVVHVLLIFSDVFFVHDSVILIFHILDTGYHVAASELLQNFTCSPCAHVSFLLLSKNMQVSGYDKLPLGWNVCVNGVLESQLG